LTNCGEVLGSLPYLAPEQLKGTTQPDRRSDLYSVGAILYEHLTGQKPFGRNRRLAPVLTDSEGDPQPPSQVAPGLSPQWDEIIRRALARDPAHRYQSAEEFLQAIEQLDQPIAAADLPLPPMRTMAIGVAIFAGLVLALVASPALNRFREVAPATAPLSRLHIAPPAFANAMTPPRAPVALEARRVVAARTAVKHAKRSARSVAAQAVVDTSPAAPVPAAYVPAAHVPAVPVPAAPSSVAPDPPKDIAPHEVAPPVAAEATAPAASQDPAPVKKHFWSKLNVFKKKKTEATEKQ
jgi:serine/threonine-protein kinase